MFLSIAGLMAVMTAIYALASRGGPRPRRAARFLRQTAAAVGATEQGV
jgi:hypothetical protein